MDCCIASTALLCIPNDLLSSSTSPSASYFAYSFSAASQPDRDHQNHPLRCPSDLLSSFPTADTSSFLPKYATHARQNDTLRGHSTQSSSTLSHCCLQLLQLCSAHSHHTWLVRGDHGALVEQTARTRQKSNMTLPYMDGLTRWDG